jgi:pilus assembly protein Flp/PilA
LRRPADPDRAGPGTGKEITMTIIKNLLADTSGASAAEYALILAIVGTGIAVAAFTLGGSISNAMNKASNCISTAPSSAGC